MLTLKAGFLYAAMVFTAGFVLGTLRVLIIVPRLGVRTAELFEMPFMLVVVIAAARWVIRRLDVPPAAAVRLGMGATALAMMIGLEIAVAAGLSGVSLDAYIPSKDPVSGTAYCIMLVVYALMPLLDPFHARAHERTAK